MALAFRRTLCLPALTASGILPILLLTGCAEPREDCDATATCPSLLVRGEAGTGTEAPVTGQHPDSSALEVSTAWQDAAPPEDGQVEDSFTVDAPAIAPEADPANVGTPLGNCDPTVLPLQAACVTNAYAVFVAPNGVESNNGSRESPFGSINRGIEASVGQGKKLVFVCNGVVPFTAPVELQERHSGIQVIGGYDCSTWAPANTATIVKTERGVIPLRIVRNKKSALRDFQFIAADADGQKDGVSSIAAFISESTGIHLTNVKLHAGKGADGAPGAEPEPNYLVSLRADDWRITGRSAVGFTGGFGQTCEDLCSDGSHSTIGTGGQGEQFLPTGGTAGSPRYSTDPTYGDAGRPDLDCDIVGACGYPGADAPSGTGGVGAARYGSLTATGWSGADGENGTSGAPGQGGGGGGGGRIRSPDEPQGGGGSGGCGGCGGSGGRGGRGGGSSFAVLSFKSDVALDGCALQVSRAGNGGSGSSGQVGQTGGTGGFGSPPGCPGGNGGKGGNGGPGGGGAGGLSVAIAYVGGQPAVPNGPEPVLPKPELLALGGAAGAVASVADAGSTEGLPLEAGAAWEDGGGSEGGALGKRSSGATPGRDGVIAHTWDLSK